MKYLCFNIALLGFSCQIVVAADTVAPTSHTTSASVYVVNTTDADVSVEVAHTFNIADPKTPSIRELTERSTSDVPSLSKNKFSYEQFVCYYNDKTEKKELTQHAITVKSVKGKTLSFTTQDHMYDTIFAITNPHRNNLNCMSYTLIDRAPKEWIRNDVWGFREAYTIIFIKNACKNSIVLFPCIHLTEAAEAGLRYESPRYIAPITIESGDTQQFNHLSSSVADVGENRTSVTNAYCDKVRLSCTVKGGVSDEKSFTCIIMQPDKPSFVTKARHLRFVHQEDAGIILEDDVDND